MKKFMTMMLGLSLVLGSVSLAFGEDAKDTTKKVKKVKVKKLKAKKTTAATSWGVIARLTGIGQGAAQALWEAFTYDDDGNPLTSTLADYAMPLYDADLEAAHLRGWGSLLRSLLRRPCLVGGLIGRDGPNGLRRRARGGRQNRAVRGCVRARLPILADSRD